MSLFLRKSASSGFEAATTRSLFGLSSVIPVTIPPASVTISDPAA